MEIDDASSNTDTAHLCLNEDRADVHFLVVLELGGDDAETRVYIISRLHQNVIYVKISNNLNKYI